MSRFACMVCSVVITMLGACGDDDTLTTRRDADPTDTGSPDTNITDTGSPDTNITDTGSTDTGLTDTGTPDTSGRDTGSPDTGAPDTGAPDAPDTGAPDTGAPEGVWTPAPGTTWQWQINGPDIDMSFDVDMYDIDLFEVSTATIDRLHADGRIVICYFSAGSYENWRDDADDLPSSARGRPLDGWPGERWLDIRNATVRTVMRARLDVAMRKGCDGVEPDNIDGYTNGTGFPLTASDQLDYNRFLAREAHMRDLSIGLKNDVDQVDALVDDFDWALNEECLEYDECDTKSPFILAGKAVFHVEYGSASIAGRVCAATRPLMFSTLIKNYDLDAWRVACD